MQPLMVGQRVYYRDHGRDDTGTVTLYSNVPPYGGCYQVKWDNGDETDFYTPEQLGTLESED